MATKRNTTKTKSMSRTKAAAKGRARKMTRAEAGKAGGLAPHKCRGRGCNMSKRAKSNSKSTNSKMTSGSYFNNNMW